MMDEKVNLVINTMRITTRDNQDVVIEPLSLDNGVLKIRYYEGTNEECPECIMPPDSFADMVRQMCKVQAPYVTDVEVVSAK